MNLALSILTLTCHNKSQTLLPHFLLNEPVHLGGSLGCPLSDSFTIDNRESTNKQLVQTSVRQCAYTQHIWKPGKPSKLSFANNLVDHLVNGIAGFRFWNKVIFSRCTYTRDYQTVCNIAFPMFLFSGQKSSKQKLRDWRRNQKVQMRNSEVSQK